jgi:hypothetical protein
VATLANRVVLHWGQNKFSRTIPLNSHGSNVATLNTAAGYSAFHAFCSDMALVNDDAIAFDSDTALVTDDADSESLPPGDEEIIQSPFDEPTAPREEATPFEFTLDGPNPGNLDVVVDQEDREPDTVAAEFLLWHQRLNHLQPAKVRLLATLGELPKRLATCRVPLCTSCVYGKATRRPWRTKLPTNHGKKTR